MEYLSSDGKRRLDRMVTSFEWAQKYIDAGWTLKEVRNYWLKDTGELYSEYYLLWEKNDYPVEP